MAVAPASVSFPTQSVGTVIVAHSGASSASSSPTHSSSSGMSQGGPGLYEFLVDAELQHYYSGIRNDLKVQNVSQLKYVADDDLHQIGMSKPEMRRLKKYFHKHFPQNYLSKFKKMILPRRDEQCRSVLLLPDERVEKPPVKVPNKHIIPAETILVNKELGTGEFGVVQQGVWANDGERIQVAIKCLSRERMQNNPIEFLKEAAIMHAIDHEHIVRLYGVVLDTSSLMLVTELAPLRSLLECLKEPSLRSSFPVLTLCDFAIQICDGMQYLEFKRLIHRDLAARNILVFSKNKVKISDFGLSRALGVGKDYYQTNFNVNLKLPIAWCAPECITFLRFTSASDVWAYGVTLWEMFSYGFQPWAALTGQQILEAIDEPNFQRLEQADCCPKDYYSIMLKCWQHDPNKRPKFADLIALLPECKPEQVQAAQDFFDEAGKIRRDQLQFRVGDVITVLDKNPVLNMSSCWKGVLNNGKTGLFNPAFTVAYLGSNLPSTKPEFTRGDGKNTYSSKRRLRPDMISSPQGDLKHTGHVGLDGAYFGDISFLGGKSSSVQYPHLPRQVVSPYKPHEDVGASASYMDHAAPGQTGIPDAIHIRHPSDTSDRAPLLACNLSESQKNISCDWTDLNKDGCNESLLSAVTKSGRYRMDHEYHEISDEENEVESPRFEKTFDFGPSLLDEMDAMFKSLGSCKLPKSSPPSNEPFFAATTSMSTGTTQDDMDEPRDLAHNARNEIKEIAARVTGKKKQAMVKPISAADQRTLESAIALANELASRSMYELEGGNESSPPPESPHTPASPNKRKFSFKFSAGNSRTSPKLERRNFTEEAASIPDIQSTLTAEAREAYNSLVEAPADSNVHVTHENDESCNPLRILRSGVAVRPRVRGNKQRHTLERPAQSSGTCDRAPQGLVRPSTTPVTNPCSTPAALSRPHEQRRSDVPPPVPAPPAMVACSPTTQAELSHQPHIGSSEHEYTEESSDDDITHTNIQDADLEGLESAEGNPIPVPPRDRKPQLTIKPRHQRKHPLIIPVEGVTRTIARMSGDMELRNQINHPQFSGLDGGFSMEPISPTQFSDTSSEGGIMMMSSQIPLIGTSARHYLIDDSFENQIASELAELDNIPEEEPLMWLTQPVPPPPPLAVPEEDDDDDEALLRNGDHVSCEDLLDFACDGPNSRRTRGPAHGSLSDEVRIMGKVLGKEASSEDCVMALNATNWDVHRAIKVAKLQALLGDRRPDMAVACEALSQCNWDVARAAEWVLANQDDSDTTEV